MKRSIIIVLTAAILMALMGSCKKQSQTAYSCQINSSASINTTQQITSVTVKLTSSQLSTSASQNPMGNIVLVMSESKNMTNPTTMTLAEKEFNGNYTFDVSASTRPLEKTYWYYIELQAPYSEIIRSETYQMPIFNVPTNSFLLEDGSCIQFAQGNLQYQASTNTWRFATNQYDMIGDGNQNISSSYSGWIDLFGFGTSGYTYKPYNYALTSSYYATTDICNTKNDWGVYCTISNGGGYSWHTLETADWVYIAFGRPNADQKRSIAVVNGEKGYLLLPDDWTLPSGCSFTPDCWGSENSYTTSQWKLMENAGAVFLPAAGFRKETTMYGISSDWCGTYFSSTWDTGGTSSDGASYCAQPVRFFFSSSNVYSSAIYTGTDVYNGYGSAVRLVRTVQEASSNAPKRTTQKIIPHSVDPMK